MIKKLLNIISKNTVGSFIYLTVICNATAQQDPQFSQYTFNTSIVNAAYAGQRDAISATVLYRSQWMGLEGAPETLTFGVHSPINRKIGIGLNAVSDRLGPIESLNINGNFSYTIKLSRFATRELSFGINAGVKTLQSNFALGNVQQSELLFSENINLTSPVFGLGIYLDIDRAFLGLSIPNFLETKHYDDFENTIASEKWHFFLIGGYVFPLNDVVKLKPSFLVKGVEGAPLIADLSMSALFSNVLSLGASYRLGDAINAILGFQISKKLYLGYAYDATVSRLANAGGTSHELLVRFEWSKRKKKCNCYPKFY